MNYAKHYLLLIEKARKRNLQEGQYHEKHHIVPKSIFSSKIAHKYLNIFDIKLKYGQENIVKLLAEEHYVAHLLLVKIFDEIDTNCYEKMVYAANFMCNRANNKNYSVLRKRYSRVLSKKLQGKPSRAKGVKWSKERKERGSPLKGKTYEEIHGNDKAKKLRSKRSETRKGKTCEEIHGEKQALKIKEKLSKRKFSKEWRKKISESKKNICLSYETKQKIRQFMGDETKNPNIDRTVYSFENVNTGEIIESTKYHMKKNYGCNSIHKIIDGRRQVCKGWKFLGEIL